MHRLVRGAAALIWIAAAGCSPPASEELRTRPESEPASGPSADAVVNASATDASPSAIGDDTLRQRLDAAINHVRSRQLLTTNSFWTIFHGMLGLGPKVELMDPVTKTKVPALPYIFGGRFEFGEIRGAKFTPTADGLDVSIGPIHVGQGHQDQFIAEMTEWGVAGDTPVVVFGKEYAFRDFVTESMARARVGRGQELSWAIVVVASHMGTDCEWTNRFGETLHFEDLVRDEVDASIIDAACGGTHRLYGLTWALFCHIRNGGRVERVWKDVEEKLAAHVELARKYQNPDGSLSSEYFKGPGFSMNPHERLASSGHILEWLVTHLSDEELRDRWIQDAVQAVSLMILDNKDAAIESGALYHATHGLVTYRQRLLGSPFPAPPQTGRQ